MSEFPHEVIILMLKEHILLLLSLKVSWERSILIFDWNVFTPPSLSKHFSTRYDLPVGSCSFFNQISWFWRYMSCLPLFLPSHHNHDISRYAFFLFILHKIFKSSQPLSFQILLLPCLLSPFLLGFQLHIFHFYLCASFNALFSIFHYFSLSNLHSIYFLLTILPILSLVTFNTHINPSIEFLIWVIVFLKFRTIVWLLFQISVLFCQNSQFHPFLLWTIESTGILKIYVW